MKSTVKYARARVRRWHSPLYTYTLPVKSAVKNPVVRAAVMATEAG